MCDGNQNFVVHVGEVSSILYSTDSVPSGNAPSAIANYLTDATKALVHSSSISAKANQHGHVTLYFSEWGDFEGNALRGFVDLVAESLCEDTSFTHHTVYTAVARAKYGHNIRNCTDMVQFCDGKEPSSLARLVCP